MNPKRTMSQALHAVNLGAEAAAFVAAGAAQTTMIPEPVSAPTPVTRRSSLPVAVPEAAPGFRETGFTHSPLPVERRAPVSLTFRLPAEVPSALLRAAMERKLRGEQPGTQQDIVAQAVREWLERNASRG